MRHAAILYSFNLRLDFLHFGLLVFGRQLVAGVFDYCPNLSYGYSVFFAEDSRRNLIIDNLSDDSIAILICQILAFAPERAK